MEERSEGAMHQHSISPKLHHSMRILRNAEGMLPNLRMQVDLLSKEPRRAWPVHVPWVPAVRTPCAIALILRGALDA